MSDPSDFAAASRERSSHAGAAETASCAPAAVLPASSESRAKAAMRQPLPADLHPVGLCIE